MSYEKKYKERAVGYMLTMNALAAAGSIIIPVQAHYLALKGLEQSLHSVAKVRRQINPKLSIVGILITMVDARTTYAKDIIALLKETYNGKLNIFDSEIPLSVRASETSAAGTSIYAHNPHGRAARSYEALTMEVLLHEN